VFYTPFNDSIERHRPYGLFGARIEYGPGHRRWTVGAYARNLMNTGYVTGTFGSPPTAFAGRPAPARQFAMEFTVRRISGSCPVRHAITTGMTVGVVPFSANQNWFSFTTSMLST